MLGSIFIISLRIRSEVCLRKRALLLLRVRAKLQSEFPPSILMRLLTRNAMQLQALFGKHR